MKVFILLAICNQLLASEIIENKKCVEDTLDISCGEGFLIEIVQLVLGDSTCYKTNCCPKADDCRRPVSYDHQRHVQQVCNGHQRCRFNVQKRSIGCTWYAPGNDYELVRYRCRGGRSTPPAAIPSSTPQRFEPKTSRINFFSMGTTPGEVSLTPSIPQPTSRISIIFDHLQQSTEQKHTVFLNAQPLHQESKQNNNVVTEQKIIGLEPIVIPIVAGLIITTLIISVACIVSKNIKLKYLRQKALNQDPNLSGMYLQPISYQTLVKACAEENACQGTSQGCAEGCDTYDSIKDVCTSLDDGYLKPADVIGRSGESKEDKEDRYIIA